MRHPIISEGPDYSAWDDASSEDDDAPALAPRRLTVAAEAGGERLDKWLAGALPEYSRTRLKQWIEDGHVRVNDARVAARAAVFEGDEVTVAPQSAPEDEALVAEPVAFGTIHEDAAVLVIDKPAGLVVHPAAGNWSGTLAHGLIYRWPELARLPRAGIVHRLDKDTSGLMVVARSLTAQTALVRQLKVRSVAREYLAIVHGHPPATGTVDAPLGRHPRERTRIAVLSETAPGARPARTHYEVLALSTIGRQKTALIRCRLETGRTHQIRVHMQYAGFALVGDPVYGGRPGDALARQALHALRLGFDHPATGVAVRFASAPPADLAELARTLGLDAALEQARRAA